MTIPSKLLDVKEPKEPKEPLLEAPSTPKRQMSVTATMTFTVPKGATIQAFIPRPNVHLQRRRRNARSARFTLASLLLLIVFVNMGAYYTLKDEKKVDGLMGFKATVTFFATLEVIHVCSLILGLFESITARKIAVWLSHLQLAFVFTMFAFIPPLLGCYVASGMAGDVEEFYGKYDMMTTGIVYAFSSQILLFFVLLAFIFQNSLLNDLLIDAHRREAAAKVQQVAVVNVEEKEKKIIQTV